MASSVESEWEKGFDDMMKTMGLLFNVILVIFLTGCLYPEDRKIEKQVPYEAQLQMVQNAVEQYREDTGVLPIMNREKDTPIYQKYPIDFSRLIPRYLQEPPGNSYENGGIYQYVLVDVERNPTVKLIDLRIVDEIRALQIRMSQYWRENQYLPFEKVISDNIFTLNYNELGYDFPPQVKSPITGQYLPFVVNGSGDIFVDYSLDLYQILQQHDHPYQTGDDIRGLIVDHSPFVPVYSLPYTIKDGEPIFLTK